MGEFDGKVAIVTGAGRGIGRQIALEDNFSEEFLAGLVESTPLGRAGAPKEIGDAVVYLSGDMGKWVTGQVLSVCGGMSIPRGDDFEELNRMMYGDEVMDACMGKEA